MGGLREMDDLYIETGAWHREMDGSREIGC